jgi:hypothetical protein
MAHAGRERALDQFTTEALTEKTLAVYRRVLTSRVGPAFPTPNPPEKSEQG